MYPLNLQGPDFLLFYGATLLAAIIALCVVRRMLRGGHVVPARQRPDLDAFEVAYLAGGPVRTVQAALVSLAHRGAVAIGPNAELAAGTMEPGRTSPAEAAVYQAVRQSSPATTSVGRVVLQARSQLHPIEDQLVGAGLHVTPSARRLATMVTLVVLFAVLVLGIAKVVVGLERNRPVGYLVLLCIVTFFTMVVMSARQLRRTPLGDAVLAEWARRNQPLRLSPENRRDDQLMLAVALFGPAMLASTAFADLQRPLQAASAGTDGGSSSSGDSGGGDGGSSCGGGGGCGGCGGGGD